VCCSSPFLTASNKPTTNLTVLSVVVLVVVTVKTTVSVMIIDGQLKVKTKKRASI